MKQVVDKKQQRTFGIGFSVILGALAAISFWKGSKIAPWVMLSVGLIFGVLGALAPFALERIYHPWMKFADKLAWFNTRLLLGFTYYVTVTPIGLLMRLVGKDPLKRRVGARATGNR